MRLAWDLCRSIKVLFTQSTRQGKDGKGESGVVKLLRLTAYSFWPRGRRNDVPEPER